MMRGVVLLGVGALCASCARPELGSRRSAAGQQDAAAADASAACAGVGYVGCCLGDTLRYCSAGKLWDKSCAAAGQHCGWDSLFSVYGCGSSATADPSGKNPRACPASDAGAPADAPRPDGQKDAVSDVNGCGAVSYAGCCLGSSLFFCAGGKLMGKSCSSDPQCGWDPSQLYYNCGTAGGADPSGAHPKACGGLPPDAGPRDAQREARADAPRADRAADRATRETGGDTPADRRRPVERGLDRIGETYGLDPSGLEVHRGDTVPTSPSSGCSCSVDGMSSSPALLLWIAALVLAVRPRRRRARPLALALGAVALLAGACTEPTQPIARSRRPFAGGDVGSGEAVKPLDAGGCTLPYEGCCAGEVLWWCETGQLKSLDCQSRPHCGWSNSKVYDCNTSGGSDPSGLLIRECGLLDARIPTSDRGTSEPSACHGVPEEGCCSGQVLFYCKDGQLRSISCAQNLFCGWHTSSRQYDCGTVGASDPSGRLALKCPPGAVPDTGPQILDQSAEAAVDRGRGDGKVPGQGCSCGVGGGPGGLLLLGLLLLVPLLVSRGRRT
jgi:MYXO-CTERM domain-containing protein